MKSEAFDNARETLAPLIEGDLGASAGDQRKPLLVLGKSEVPFSDILREAAEQASTGVGARGYVNLDLAQDLMPVDIKDRVVFTQIFIARGTTETDFSMLGKTGQDIREKLRMARGAHGAVIVFDLQEGLSREAIGAVMNIIENRSLGAEGMPEHTSFLLRTRWRATVEMLRDHTRECQIDLETGYAVGSTGVSEKKEQSHGGQPAAGKRETRINTDLAADGASAQRDALLETLAQAVADGDLAKAKTLLADAGMAKQPLKPRR